MLRWMRKRFELVALTLITLGLLAAVVWLIYFAANMQREYQINMMREAIRRESGK